VLEIEQDADCGERLAIARGGARAGAPVDGLISVIATAWW
jgi:hypothetical protein